MKKTKLALFQSVVSLLLCISMLMGTTFAWFTDSVTSTGNIIQSGTLKAGLEWTDSYNGQWNNADKGAIFNYSLWEPGFTQIRYIKISNLGNLAFQYRLNIVPEKENTEEVNLADVIDVYIYPGDTVLTSRNELDDAHKAGTLSQLMAGNNGAAQGHVLAGASEEYCVVLKMQESAGNEYQNRTVGGGFRVVLLASQYTHETDSFGDDYDQNAEYPEVTFPENDLDVSVSVPVTPDENNLLPQNVTLTSADGKVTAQIPAGTLLEPGTTALTLTVTDLDSSAANIQLGETEISRSVDVHIAGVAAGNTVPMTIAVKEMMPQGLNIGNYTFYHVENGQTNQMTLAATPVNHNDFSYDPATGDVTMALATFSEIATVADTENEWKGKFDYTWYDASKTELTIANADQLAAFGAIVGGMKGQTQDSFAGKTVKLISDINLGDKDNANESLIFHPIGYYYTDDKNADGTTGDYYSTVYSFEGTFDGNGHTIANFYHNTWEIKGNYEGNYYSDAMGLFGYVVGSRDADGNPTGGIIKNLTVDNFSSDGEFTPTGVVAAYAVNSTFENIAITNCNPRVYNTGNGGIVGIGGNSDDPDDYKLTFTNITIDNTNKITALWGSWDVACGGLVGMFRGAGHVYMTNCHVGAQIDVYNDVCGNYQYYWYRYSGMMIGTNKNMTTDDKGYTVPETDKFHAENCTVHFGDWNDYYYCELVANSLASYTHDHQFSRLTQVKAVNGTTITPLEGDAFTVPASGRYNYVVVNGEASTENATCYHFVDGKVWNHADAGEETVDVDGDGVKETVLKEDRQHYYLPFNQLFTGYGWGVKHVPIYDDGTPNPFAGVTILDRTEANSVEKFVKAENSPGTVTAGTEYTVGTFFAEKPDISVPVKEDKVQVFVSPVDSQNTIYADFEAGADEWQDGKLKIYGTGEATITITDYYYCEPYTITVTVEDNGFLYRVGNQNGITYAQLSKLLTGNASYSSLNVTTLNNGHNVSLEKNESNELKFVGTGVVGVQINGVQYYLEVVDAVNATAKTDAKDKNVVLLNNISGGFTVSNGFAVYGNGFKVTCSGDGSYRSAAVSYGFVTVENGGILDNVQIICDIFPESYLYTSEMQAGSDGRYPYGYSAVVVSGNSTISNCYIYGARNNIQVGEGNVTIENTVLECGSLSNIHIKSSNGYTATLDNVTTIQYQTTSKYDTSKKVLGFGILVGTNESESNANLVLKGDLKQYNWVTSSDTSVSNSYAKSAINAALNDKEYRHTVSGTNTVNMGIVYLNTLKANITDDRTNQKDIPYQLKEITISGKTGQVYSIKAGSQVSENSRYDAEIDGVIPYTPSAQRVIAPQVSHSGVNSSSLTINTAYNNAWVTTFTADLDNITGGNYNFTFNDLVIKKYGKDLVYTVKDTSGNTVEKSTVITLNQLYTGEYTLIITDDVVYNSNGQLSGEKVTHEMPFVLYATKTSIDPPKFTNAGTATAIRLVTSKDGDWRPAYTVLTGVSVTYWSASEGKVKTVDLSTLYNSGKISSNVWTYTCDDYTLTITGGAVHSDGTTITPVVANNTLYFASTNKAFGTGTTSRNIVLTYVFTDKNASTTWNRTETVKYSDLSEYDYNSFKNNGTLKEPSNGTSPCVTSDTLVTLADGTQKEIQYLTYEDQLLVWDFFKGEYTAVSPAIIFDHGYDNNTVIELKFSDGTAVKVVNLHQFFDAELNRFVTIDAESVARFVGHEFIRQNNDGYETVTLVDYTITQEYCEAWGIISAEHYNIIVEGMLSADFEKQDFPLFNYFEVGDDMKFDRDRMNADIETYGLYTYEEFAEYLTYEQFTAFNVPYFKIPVGKGEYTFEGILALIETYLNN